MPNMSVSNTYMFGPAGDTYNMIIVDSSCQEDDYRAAVATTRPDIGFRCCK